MGAAFSPCREHGSMGLKQVSCVVPISEGPLSEVPLYIYSIYNCNAYSCPPPTQERAELFVTGESVRPGILVLVNSTDWELLGQLDYTLQPNDHVIFISTLHGG